MTAQTALKAGYGLVPIVAGADKFTNLLCDWEQYLSPAAERLLPIDGKKFMKLVGLIEIGAGLIVLSRKTRFGAFLVSGWLSAIALNLLSSKHYDIAARDALLAIGAYALGRLSGPKAEREETRSLPYMNRPQQVDARMVPAIH
ncbi:MAG: hypothetical protein ABR567_03990 [Myxococcales bacterium]|nr:hypothetical protein [Myxococcales bacterium]